MIQKKTFFILLLVGLAGCTGNHRPITGKEAPATHSEQTAPTTRPFKQIDLTAGEEFPEKTSYKELHFAIDYSSATDFLRVSDSHRKKTFSLTEKFSGLGVNLRLFDNDEVQLLSMELEYEFMVSVHFFVINSSTIRESAIADVEILSDDFAGLKYNVSNTSDGAAVKIAGGVEPKDVAIHF